MSSDEVLSERMRSLKDRGVFLFLLITSAWMPRASSAWSKACAVELPLSILWAVVSVGTLVEANRDCIDWSRFCMFALQPVCFAASICLLPVVFS